MRLKKGEPHGVMRKRIFDFILKITAEQGFAPTVRQICEGVGLSSPDSVQYHIVKLRESGHIKKWNNHARTIRRVESCPHCGKVIFPPVPLTPNHI